LNGDATAYNKHNNYALFNKDYCGSTLPLTEFNFYEFAPALRCYAKRFEQAKIHFD